MTQSHQPHDHAAHAAEHAHPRRADLLSVEDALERVLALVTPLPEAAVPLMDADGLTLARDVTAPFDIPALPNSAMDGYAVRVADLDSAGETNPRHLDGRRSNPGGPAAVGRGGAGQRRAHHDGRADS